MARPVSGRMSHEHQASGGAVAPSTEVLIGDSTAQHVLIRPLSRSNPGLFDIWDGNRIDCEVEIAAGGFRGRLRADLRSDEFQTFSEQVEGLNRTIEGVASLTSVEGQIALSLTVDGNGRVRASGEALDAAGAGNRLQFGFDVDRTRLPEISRSLAYLLAAFPVVGASDADKGAAQEA
jgi:hypothetical protein